MRYDRWDLSFLLTNAPLDHVVIRSVNLARVQVWVNRKMKAAKGRSGREAGKRGFIRLRLEQLEDRMLPSTFVVSNTGDNGAVNPAPFAGTGTLRQAIIDANANPGVDTINFAIGTGAQTIFVNAQ